MTPKERLGQYKTEGGDLTHRYINKLIEKRVLGQAIVIAEGNLIPEDWNVSEKETKRIKHELMTKQDGITGEITLIKQEIAGEDLEKIKAEAMVLNDEDIREMAKEKLHILANVHHFSRVGESEKFEGITYDSDHKAD